MYVSHFSNAEAIELACFSSLALPHPQCPVLQRAMGRSWGLWYYLKVSVWLQNQLFDFACMSGWRGHPCSLCPLLINCCQIIICWKARRWVLKSSLKKERWVNCHCVGKQTHSLCWGKRAEGAKWLKWERLEAGGLRSKKGDKTMYLREMLSCT